MSRTFPHVSASDTFLQLTDVKLCGFQRPDGHSSSRGRPRHAVRSRAAAEGTCLAARIRCYSGGGAAPPFSENACRPSCRPAAVTQQAQRSAGVTAKRCGLPPWPHRRAHRISVAAAGHYAVGTTLAVASSGSATAASARGCTWCGAICDWWSWTHALPNHGPSLDPPTSPVECKQCLRHSTLVAWSFSSHWLCRHG